jgi:N6-adenosine-specific RNA methylase IME4
VVRTVSLVWGNLALVVAHARKHVYALPVVVVDRSRFVEDHKKAAAVDHMRAAEVDRMKLVVVAHKKLAVVVRTIAGVVNRMIVVVADKFVVEHRMIVVGVNTEADYKFAEVVADYIAAAADCTIVVGCRIVTEVGCKIVTEVGCKIVTGVGCRIVTEVGCRIAEAGDIAAAEADYKIAAVELRIEVQLRLAPQRTPVPEELS